MDLVEEFLELGKNVSVTTLVEFLRVLRKRIPGRYLPKNLKDLVSIDETDTKNVGRQFWAWLNKQRWRRMLPQPMKVDVLMKDERLLNPHHLSTWHMFLPSDAIHAMYSYDESLFRERWLGPPGALKKFWDAQKGTRWFQSHPILSKPDIDLETYFPILCHGDDADSHRRRSFCCFTIASPLAPSRSSWDTRVLLYIVDTSRVLPETYDVLDSWVVLGLCELQEGEFMNVDIYGRPWARGKSGRICGKYTGVWVALKGDQKFLQRALKLNTSATSDQVCMYCRATSTGELVYTSFGPSAPHRSTLVTNDFFFHRGCRPNSWLRLPGFDVERVLADWLHLVDLSLIPEVSASALIELTSDDSVWPGDSQDERLRMAFVQFTAECKKHRVRNKCTHWAEATFRLLCKSTLMVLKLQSLQSG